VESGDPWPDGPLGAGAVGGRNAAKFESASKMSAAAGTAGRPVAARGEM